jgi:hypothetical protein
MGLLSRTVGSAALYPAHSGNYDTSGSIVEKVTQYQKTYGRFNCILFEIPDGGSDLCQKLAGMIKYTGIVIPLSPSRPLILLPSSVDRELIVHRLSKTLKAAPLFSFEAGSPKSVLSKINSIP